MQNGSIHARMFDTGKPVRIQWVQGRIQSLKTVSDPPPQELWVAPPLFDPQINGYAGIDFQQDNLSQDDLLTATRGLRRDGCARFFLTLITDAWPRLTARLRHLKTVRDSQPELREAILGWHVEGPFLSPEPGFHGAHDPACMLDPSPNHLLELRNVAGSDELLITLAPERDGTLESLAWAAEHRIHVHFGHSNASRDTLARACAKIIPNQAAFTHLGNACPQQLDRHDNIIWRVLDIPELWCSLIPDGIHVSPELFRLIHRVNKDRIVYTTDAMSAAGAPPGRHRLGKLELEVGEDGVVRQPGRTNFAGSSCTPLQGVVRAAQMTCEPWQSAWARFTAHPARLFGLNLDLAAGQPANFCVATPGGSDEKPWSFAVYHHGAHIQH